MQYVVRMTVDEIAVLAFVLAFTLACIAVWTLWRES